MSYIAPNTDIQFFPDIGLSKSHDNTFYFASTAAKDTYFSSLTPLATAAACTYQRGVWGQMRVQIAMSVLIGAGYCRYKNASFENKWFYAFVDRVEYVNNECSEVYFTIDNLMTWMGDYVLGQCMVEREHTLSDTVGEHLIDEGLSVGDYVIDNVEDITPFVPVLCISTTSQMDGSGNLENAEAHMYSGNMLSGAAYQVYDLSSTTSISAAIAFLNKLIDDNKQNAVICLRIIPAYAGPLQSAIAENIGAVSGGTFGSQYSVTALDGYIPSNNKMFSYPYIVYEVINGEGSANEYRLELFANALTPSFLYRGICFDACEVILVPQGYKKAGLNLVYDEAMIMRSFPQASFNVDQYKAYVAQMTSGGGWLNVLGNLTKGLISSAESGSVSGAVGTLVDTAFDLLQDSVEYESLPAAVKGTSNANIMAAMGTKKFIGYHKSIMSERARSIDRYFTMYGYKVNLVKTPSCNNRPHFTYVKTQGCIVHGNLPADAAEEIEQIFDRGVRFWAVPSEIGDYTLNNSPGV